MEKGIRTEAAASTPEVRRQGRPVEKPGRRPVVRPERETGVLHAQRRLRHQAVTLLEHCWGGGSMGGRAGQELHLSALSKIRPPRARPLTCLCQSQLERGVQRKAVSGLSQLWSCHARQTAW